MRQILTNDIEVPQPLERLGQIASFFLTAPQYFYRKIIAEVWLDKHPETKTVFNREWNPSEMKFSSEYIMGDKNTKIKVKKGDKYELILDYLNTNYTTRLEDEYNEFLLSINMNYTICDFTADYGYITIDAAKKGCKVIANSENQMVYSMLLNNLSKNLLERLNQVKIYNLQTDEFIKQIVSPSLDFFHVKKKPSPIDVIYINDPIKAMDYIKEIIRALRKTCENRTIQSNIWNVGNLPKIYFYHSSTKILTKNFFVDKLKQIFELECGYYSFNDKCIIKMKENRNIYPNYYFYCLYIRIPAAAIFGVDYVKNHEVQIRPSICSLNIGDMLGFGIEQELPNLLGKREQLKPIPEKPIAKKAKLEE